MCIVSLSNTDRAELRRLVRSAPRVRISGRAQALLALDRGETVASVARQLLSVSPIDLGYRHTTWTTPLLQARLASESIETSAKTIR